MGLDVGKQFGVRSILSGPAANRDLPTLLDRDIVNGLLGDMKVEAIETLLSEGVSRERIVLSLSADVRYVGQFSEVEVPFKTEMVAPAAVGELMSDFHTLHEALNGYRMHAAPAEFVNLHVVGRGIVEKPQLLGAEGRTSGSTAALTGHRKAFFRGGFIDVPVYDGFQLAFGENVSGPAIVEQETTTVVVQPGHTLTCDMFGNGGGGYGNPFERDAAAVVEDVTAGLLSVQSAREQYAVVVDPETLAVDLPETARLRGCARITSQNWRLDLG